MLRLFAGYVSIWQASRFCIAIQCQWHMLSMLLFRFFRVTSQRLSAFMSSHSDSFNDHRMVEFVFSTALYRFQHLNTTYRQKHLQTQEPCITFLSVQIVDCNWDGTVSEAGCFGGNGPVAPPRGQELKGKVCRVSGIQGDLEGLCAVYACGEVIQGMVRVNQWVWMLS